MNDNPMSLIRVQTSLVSGSTNSPYETPVNRTKSNQTQPVPQKQSKVQQEDRDQVASQGTGSKVDRCLRFNIDPKTNDITVMVIDRTSNRVIRTIPPDELRTFIEGPLMEILV
jgi:uncharacterized FlaG/YvyC family protein